jgi:hypothetical protein
VAARGGCRFLASPALAQEPAQDSPDRPEAGVVGAYLRKRASDSLKPSGTHLATKARVCDPVGDAIELSKAVSRPSASRLMRSCDLALRP